MNAFLIIFGILCLTIIVFLARVLPARIRQRDFISILGRGAGIAFLLTTFSFLFLTAEGYGPLASWAKYKTELADRRRPEKIPPQGKKRLLKSLDCWTKRWARMNSYYLKKHPEAGYSYPYLARSDKNVWAIVGIPYAEPQGLSTKVFVFHSKNNGRDWEIKWEKPNVIRKSDSEERKKKKRAWAFHIGLTGIRIIKQKGVCIRLSTNGAPPETWMMYSLDEGETWEIDHAWNPEKLRDL